MSETLAAGDGVKTYRGSSIEELLPKIREDLGPEAVILRQREGLVGGVGGFFQKKCVEVEARAGGPGIDVYDEEPDEEAGGQRVLSQGEGGAAGGGVLDPPPPAPPAGTASAADGDPLAAAATSLTGVSGGAAAASVADELPPLRNDVATREGLASPAVQQIVAEAQPFADLLGELSDPAPAAEPAGSVPVHGESFERTAKAEALLDGMIAAGLGADLAEEVVDAVVASALPFATPARLRTLVRDELALRMPVAAAAAPGPRAIALVGPAGAGKTAAAARICAAHAAAGAAVTCLTIAPSGGAAALRQLLGDAEVQVVVVEDPARIAATGVVRPSEGDALLVVDTPPTWAEAPALPALTRALKKLDLDEVHAVMRAGTAAAAGNELIAGLRRLAPNRLLATGLGETGHLGSIADVAIRAELPLGYLAEGAAEIAPAEPRGLASRIVP